MIVYLVWANEEDCGSDNCSCYPRSLDGIFTTREAAEAVAKMRWGGRVEEQKVLDKTPNY